MKKKLYGTFGDYYDEFKRLWNGNIFEKSMVCFIAHCPLVLPHEASCEDCREFQEKSCPGKGLLPPNGVFSCMIEKVVSGNFKPNFIDG